MYAESELLIKEVVSTIRKLVRVVSLNSSKINRQYGLTGPQGSVLRILIKEGPLSSASLSRRLYVTPSNITGIIDRLRKKGLVERIKKKGDRRTALITLTESGTELSNSLPDPIEKKLIYELADLEPEHVRKLSLVMNQILNLINAKGVDDAFLELHHAPSPISNEDKNLKL